MKKKLKTFWDNESYFSNSETLYRAFIIYFEGKKGADKFWRWAFGGIYEKVTFFALIAAWNICHSDGNLLLVTLGPSSMFCLIQEYEKKEGIDEIYLLKEVYD